MSADCVETKKAILYGRVSTEEQVRKGYSLAHQFEASRDYAALEGYEVLAEVADPGQSGATLDRPGMDRVRDLVSAGGIAIVLAQDADRITRDPAHRALIDEEMERFGTRLVALDDWGDDSHEGQLLRYMKGWVSKGERLKTAERTRRGRLRKAREGELIGNGNPDYGFVFNERKDGYDVNPETMPIVERVLRKVGEEQTSIHGVVDALNREGVPAPSGGRWNRTFVRKLILDDVYRAHSYEEVTTLVSAEVAAKLNPEKRYGIFWYNRVRRQNWQISEVGPGGTREYRTKSTITPRPREEWIAMPVVDPGIPREVVDAAREAIKGNRKTSSAGSRFWELSGGIARCAECGRALTPLSVKRKKSGKVDLYYRCLGHWHEHKCSNSRHHRADYYEATVAEGIWWSLREPDKLLSHIDERIEQERRRDIGREAEVLRKRVTELDLKISRAQDLAIDGLLSKSALEERITKIRAERAAAERQLETLENERVRIEELERQREEILRLYATGLMTAFSHYSPEDRHEIYKKLKLRARICSYGILELAGTFNANVLPTDPYKAREGYERMKRSRSKSSQHLLGSRHTGARRGDAGYRSETTTTRRSR